MIEREMKAEYEIDSLEMGPRDSKRKWILSFYWGKYNTEYE